MPLPHQFRAARPHTLWAVAPVLACCAVTSREVHSDVGRPKKALAFDPKAKPPRPAPVKPRAVVVVMRHGDRTPIHPVLGDQDLSHLAPLWAQTLPTAAERSVMDRFEVAKAEVGPKGGDGIYGQFLGSGPYGQLTSLGFAQCRAIGEELRRRYPGFGIRAFSTDFPRTIDSVKGVLCGFEGAAATGAAPVVTIRSQHDEFLLPNYDGKCMRYSQLFRERSAAAAEAYVAQRSALDRALQPLLGSKPGDDAVSRLRCPNHFKIQCVHAATVGSQPGVHYDLAHLIDEYMGLTWTYMHEDKEFVQLGSGRLVRWVSEALAAHTETPQLYVSAAHDSTLLPFMVALDVHRGDWPVFASAIVLEVADLPGRGAHVRILVNDEVRLDWQPWAAFQTTARVAEMSEEAYTASCNADISVSKL